MLGEEMDACTSYKQVIECMKSEKTTGVKYSEWNNIWT